MGHGLPSHRWSLVKYTIGLAPMGLAQAALAAR